MGIGYLVVVSTWVLKMLIANDFAVYTVLIEPVKFLIGGMGLFVQNGAVLSSVFFECVVQPAEAIAGGVEVASLTCWTVFLISTFALVALVVYLWLGSVKQRRLLMQQQVEFDRAEALHADNICSYRTREVVSRILEQEYRNRLIEKLKVKINKVQSKLPEEASGLLNGLVVEVDKHAEKELWLRFEADFLAIHPAFMRSLKVRYPELSSNDLKICALVRAGVITKDIAPIVNLGVKTVEATRTRLRRMFDLAPNDTLGEFLQRF